MSPLLGNAVMVFTLVLIGLGLYLCYRWFTAYTKIVSMLLYILIIGLGLYMSHYFVISNTNRNGVIRYSSLEFQQ